jgi:hypothetical protein
MKNIKIELKWGILFVLSGLIWMIIEKSLGWHDALIDKQAAYSLFYAPIAIAIYVFALLDKKRNFYQGRMTFMQGFVSGLIITLVVVILSPLSQYITHGFITPDYFDNAIDFAVSSRATTQEIAEANFNLNSYMVQAMVGAAIMGSLTSAVVALFTRSKS